MMFIKMSCASRVCKEEISIYLNWFCSNLLVLWIFFFITLHTLPMCLHTCILNALNFLCHVNAISSYYIKAHFQSKIEK